MFKDKELRVRMVPKDLKTETVEISATDHTLDKVDEIVKDILKEGASLLLIYIAADTIRKVIVELAKK